MDAGLVGHFSSKVFQGFFRGWGDPREELVGALCEGLLSLIGPKWRGDGDRVMVSGGSPFLGGLFRVQGSFWTVRIDGKGT